MLQPILRERKPGPGSTELLYSPNVGNDATGTVFCMNQAEPNDKISIALVSNGSVLTSNCWIAYGTVIHGGHSVYLQEICLGEGDQIWIRSDEGYSSFVFTGRANP